MPISGAKFNVVCNGCGYEIEHETYSAGSEGLTAVFDAPPLRVDGWTIGDGWDDEFFCPACTTAKANELMFIVGNGSMGCLYDSSCAYEFDEFDGALEYMRDMRDEWFDTFAVRHPNDKAEATLTTLHEMRQMYKDGEFAEGQCWIYVRVGVLQICLDVINKNDYEGEWD